MRKNMPDQSVLRKLLRYDAERGLLIWKEAPHELFETETKWKRFNSALAGTPAFNGLKSNGYKIGYLFGQSYFAHRVIWKLLYNDEPVEIDHIDGDKSNNLLSNLRAANQAMNRRNQRMSSRNTSGITGVYQDKRTGNWRALIKAGGKLTHLGIFPSKDEAIAVRKSAEAEFGFHENHGRAA